MFTKHQPHAGHRNGRKMTFLSLVTLIVDLWPLTLTFKVQTRQSERANTSSVWICRKSVQRFPGYFIHKQNVKYSAKNRTLCRSLHAVRTQFSKAVRGNSWTLFNDSGVSYLTQWSLQWLRHLDHFKNYDWLINDWLITCFAYLHFIQWKPHCDKPT